jgi:Protein of unknown function, DUF547
MKQMLLIFTLSISLSSLAEPEKIMQPLEAEALSQQFFDAVKNNNSAQADFLATRLAEFNPQELKSQLDSDAKTLAFWMNIYNTSVQYILKKDPSKFDDRGAFFKAKQITIAGEVLSLDIIEHGILRKSKSKLSLGFLRKIKVSKFERTFRINKVDARIHYALNCGALSCPPIVAYHSEKIEQELDLSVSDYLKKYCVVGENDVKVPVLFSWFRADFGKKRGIKKFLVKYGITTKADKKKDLKFLDYDWTLALDPYKY